MIIAGSPLILHNINNFSTLSGLNSIIVDILFFNFLIGHSLTLHSLRKTTQHC
nr:MAG TPA: hypothetical protein [Caudoviricetes sp.]